MILSAYCVELRDDSRGSDTYDAVTDARKIIVKLARSMSRQVTDLRKLQSNKNKVNVDSNGLGSGEWSVNITIPSKKYVY